MKKFALIFRSLALIITVASFISGCGGLWNNIPAWGDLFIYSLRYYTLQSNLFVLALFVYLVIATAKSLIRGGREGNACFSPRFCAGALNVIMLNFFSFWTMLFPTYTNPGDAFEFSSIGVHFFVPLLMLADYIIFTSRHNGQLKKYDPFLFALVPAVYLILATIMGFALQPLYITADGIARHFPYFFLDYENLGWMAAVYITSLFIFYLALGFLMYFIDRKVQAKTTPHT